MKNYKMWIDGKEVYYDAKGTNPANVDKAKVPFSASKGEHEVLVALDKEVEDRRNRRRGRSRARSRAAGHQGVLL